MPFDYKLTYYLCELQLMTLASDSGTGAEKEGLG